MRTFQGKYFDEAKIGFSNFQDLIDSQSNNQNTFIINYENPHEKKEITYSIFVNQCKFLAIQLSKKYSLKPSTPVMVCFENSIDQLIVYGALLYLNIPLVPVDPHELKDYYLEIQKDCKASLIISKNENSQFPSTLHNHYFQYSNLNSPITKEDLKTHIQTKKDPKSLAAIFYSSGTTGKPKGSCLTQAQIFANAEGVKRTHNFSSKLHHFTALPLHHVNAFNFSFIGCLYSSARLVLCRAFFQTTFWQILKSEKINIASLVPSIIKLLSKDPRENPFESKSTDLKYFVTAAAPLMPKDFQDFYGRYKIKILQSYGLSEAVNFSLCNPTNLSTEEYEGLFLNQHQLPVGQAFWGNDVELLDENDNIIPTENTAGELSVRGWNIMQEYLNQPDLTKEIFKNDWLHTGDIAYFKNFKGKKLFYISGRKKEIIKRNGITLVLAEIDQRLTQFLSFEFCCVGFENDFTGEEIGLFIPKSDAKIDEQQLLDKCKEWLPINKRPKAIVRGESIPKTSTGKIKRKELSKLFHQYKSSKF
ncbi:MAG: acyl--CoA ligase [Bdellovibrionaceae bacterium]|nr:acyl--CoA ligase [Pseudobdellovibrionaceae bacterium]